MNRLSWRWSLIDEILNRVIISGGGSGGHIFPAIAIANALRARFPQVEILFVGARGKIEMEKVPRAGYRIQGLWISGLQRSLTWRNLLFPIKVLHSLWTARNILKRFNPEVVIGVGGFASGPTLFMATRLGIPTIIQEQNSYAGLTNKWLSKYVDRICVAYDEMHKYFPKEKIISTGNPVRNDLISTESVVEARHHFGLSGDKKTILLVGGSLGARTFNQVMRDGSDLIDDNPDIQWIWQIGKIYQDTYLQTTTAQLPNVCAKIFLDRMDLAYRAADLVICRAGALTIAELCLLGKASVLVPSPNVAEDHQTVNARAVAAKGAAYVIEDRHAPKILVQEAIQFLHDENKLKQWSANAKKMATPQATMKIIEEILAVANMK